MKPKSTIIVRGLLGTGPLNPILESASPPPPQGSILHRFDIEIGSNREIDVVSMPIRCRIDAKSTPEEGGGRGGFEGGVRGACA